MFAFNSLERDVTEDPKRVVRKQTLMTKYILYVTLKILNKSRLGTNVFVIVGKID